MAFNDTVREELDDCPSYENLEKALQKASQKIITKEYKKSRKPKVFGYNKTLKNEISTRRTEWSEWKKEKDATRKKEKQ